MRDSKMQRTYRESLSYPSTVSQCAMELTALRHEMHKILLGDKLTLAPIRDDIQVIQTSALY